MGEEEYKYCTECGTEYYAHIEDCADCGVPLKTNAEIEELKNKEKRSTVDKSTQAVAIREGDKNWIQELCNHLEKTGFHCKIICSPACNPGGCGETFQLIVPSGDAEEASHCVEEYNHEIHPELKESFENSEKGKCPACGYDVGSEAVECPDCGLMLVIDEEE